MCPRTSIGYVWIRIVLIPQRNEEPSHSRSAEIDLQVPNFHNLNASVLQQSLYTNDHVPKSASNILPRLIELLQRNGTELSQATVQISSPSHEKFSF